MKAFRPQQQDKRDKNSRISDGLVTARRKVNPLSPPTTVELQGIRIHFPFRPYKCQETYMVKVLDALLRSENALLESPTGTGKTLCLLCATLAWQREQARLIQSAADLHSTTTIQASQLDTLNTGAAATILPSPNRSNVPVIVYASRTHSQLSQVVRELRNTRYRPHHAVLGSREQMCVHPKVKKAHSTAADVNHDCNRMGQERKCRYRNNLEGFTAPANEEGMAHNMQPVMDMEDMIEMGKEHKVCPFYYTRSHLEKAELVLVPYNYLFDKEARATTLADIPWNNAVVIFDEAHNLESFASDSASFDLSTTDLAGCKEEIRRAQELLKNMPDNAAVSAGNLDDISGIFTQLEFYLVNLSAQQTAYTGEFMMDFFQRGGRITHTNHELMIDALRKVNDLIMDARGTGATRGAPRLEHFCACLKRVYGHGLESRCYAKAACYRVHVSAPRSGGGERGGGQAGAAGRTISYWCFAPALAMEELANLNIRSIIVTSGTLSPLPSYSMELGLPFAHTLENPHIVGNDQIHVRVIGKGVTSKVLTSSFERRKDDDYYIELGNTLVALAKVIPMGMLVFFPSYSVMAECLERWGGPASGHHRTKQRSNARDQFFARRRKIEDTRYSFPHQTLLQSAVATNRPPWQRLLSVKAVVTEPKSSSDLNDAIAEYRRFLELPKTSGAVLMGVCRGKISEGIDFANDMCRAVVITGLPFPPSHDARVKLKREYLDGARAQGNVKPSADGGFGGANATSKKAVSLTHSLSGHEWYSQQAHRAVNQAIGRVIRNRSDYGAVLLLDSRFDQARNHDGLSRWLRPHLQNDEGFGRAVSSLAKFYKVAYEQDNARKVNEVKMAEKFRLEYEVENADEAAITHVAFVRTGIDAAEQQQSDGGETNEASYIAPKDVVARIGIESLSGQRSDDNAFATDAKPAVHDLFSRTHETNVSRAPQLDKPAADSKQIAAKFMRLIQSRLPSNVQADVKKFVFAMKQHGDRKDVHGYLKVARNTIRLLLKHEKFDQVAQTEETAVLLLLQLLPKAYQADGETTAMKEVFDASDFGSFCKENTNEKHLLKVKSTTVSILRKVWCCKTEDRPDVTQVLPLLRNMFDVMAVEVAVKRLSRACAALSKLMPAPMIAPTRSLFDELVIAKKMSATKRADNVRCENEGSLPLPSGPSPADSIPAPSATTQFKTRTKNPYSNASSKPSASNSHLSAISPNVQQQSAQPYTEKAAANDATGSTSKAKPGRPSLATLIRTVEADIYLKKCPRDELDTLKSNVPLTLGCQVCSDAPINVPLLATCGHVACKNCWLTWLRRNKSCPTCRASIDPTQLAQAIFQTAAEGATKDAATVHRKSDGSVAGVDGDGVLPRPPAYKRSSL